VGLPRLGGPQDSEERSSVRAGAGRKKGRKGTELTGWAGLSVAE